MPEDSLGVSDVMCRFWDFVACRGVGGLGGGCAGMVRRAPQNKTGRHGKTKHQPTTERKKG